MTEIVTPEETILASGPAARPPALTVGDLTRDQLRDEVSYWRQNAAAQVQMALAELNQQPTPEQPPWRYSVERRLREQVANLGCALRGDLFESCGACPEPIRPGDPVVQYEDVGEVHARCAGASPSDIEAGRIAVPFDALNTEDLTEEEIAAARADPHMRIYPSEPYYTEARITEVHARGREKVAQIEAADEAGVADANGVRTCRLCGCTEANACVKDGRACAWATEDVCTACVEANFDLSQGVGEPDAIGGRYGVTTSDSPDFRTASAATEAWFTRRDRAEGFATWLAYPAVWDLVAGVRVWPDADTAEVAAR